MMPSALGIEVFVNFILCFQGKVVLLHPSNVIHTVRDMSPHEKPERGGLFSFLYYALICIIKNFNI